MMNDNDRKARKARRISRACDYCHKRSIRCKASQDDNDSRCQNCIDFGQACTYDRPAKRRGVRPHTNRSSGATQRDGVGWTSPKTPKSASEDLNAGHQSYQAQEAQGEATNGAATSTQWRAPNVANQAMVMDLVEIYFEVAYPIFPFFHRPTFLRQISRGEYNSSRFLFASTMAVCALASARARDGAILSARWNRDLLKEPPSEAFYQAATSCLPLDLIPARNHNCMRAQALLAITAIQYGQMRTMHQALARYSYLVAVDGLQDEANWPKDIGFVETEERRRLFWSMYTLDVFRSIVWNGTMRVREAQYDVNYPIEMDDDLFDDNGFQTVSSLSAHLAPSPTSRLTGPIRASSWLCGWNFTTDLYRIMEHAIDNFRSRRIRLRRKSFLQDIFGESTAKSQSSVLASVMEMYADLPQRFKEIQPICLDMVQDRFGFQAANITATIQLLRMVLFSNAGASISDRCEIASEVVNAFINIPLGYLRAISSPLLHHLAGIGSILSTVFEEPLSQPEYFRVRSVLLTMAQLLSNLDTLHSTTNASERLRSHIDKMDDFMGARHDSFSRRQEEGLIMTGGTSDEHAVTNDGSLSANHDYRNQPPDLADPTLSHYQLPQELLEDWPWIFDFGQEEQ